MAASKLQPLVAVLVLVVVVVVVVVVDTRDAQLLVLDRN